MKAVEVRSLREKIEDKESIFKKTLEQYKGWYEFQDKGTDGSITDSPKIIDNIKKGTDNNLISGEENIDTGSNYKYESTGLETKNPIVEGPVRAKKDLKKEISELNEANKQKAKQTSLYKALNNSLLSFINFLQSGNLNIDEELREYLNAIQSNIRSLEVILSSLKGKWV